MKIALLGYGKMGKELEQVALERNHHIVLRADIETISSLKDSELKTADVALEFSTPDSAYNNVALKLREVQQELQLLFDCSVRGKLVLFSLAGIALSIDHDAPSSNTRRQAGA